VLVARKPHWFEKFRWFISSDGIIVVAGSDAQQNEQLVKKYMRPQVVWCACRVPQPCQLRGYLACITHVVCRAQLSCVQCACRTWWLTTRVVVAWQDVYVHAELHGAASCVVRSPSNKPSELDIIPPATLEQAGQFTVSPRPPRFTLSLATPALPSLCQSHSAEGVAQYPAPRHAVIRDPSPSCHCTGLPELRVECEHDQQRVVGARLPGPCVCS
jgi:hypothetical protein